MPHVGMWIETFKTEIDHLNHEVMPHVGMWIETYLPWLNLFAPVYVMPHVGMWIETSILC